ncbi:macro domain-containing protein [candidate division KSB1 bacterium]|nr:macro domain-containing protein [candidate division KSB1 bacterium]
MKKLVGQTWIELIQGDITELNTDAIVNAANSALQHGGGVAGAIVKKGGQSIQEESDLWVKVWGGEVNVGSCAITSAGNLPARYVIHAVGPRMGEGDEDEKLQKATLSSLKMADNRNLHSITFPAISTGIFGYPIDRCAEIMLSTVYNFLKEDTKLKKIVFCLYDQDALDIFEEFFNKHIAKSD